MEDETKIKQIFLMFDRDNNGQILTKDLASVLRLIGRNPTNEEIKIIEKKMDTNSVGKVGYTTFLDVYSTADLINEPSREDLKAAFRVFDKDGLGFVTVNELRYIMLHLGDRLSDNEFQDIINEGSLDRNGKIYYDDILTSILKI